MKLSMSSPGILSATESACAGMEPLAVDDDICILKHETAYTAGGESPLSVCAGDESVASHFALVTAYEDIKKRLRDTERENTLLRKRVKQLEDKVNSEGTVGEKQGHDRGKEIAWGEYIERTHCLFRWVYKQTEIKV